MPELMDGIIDEKRKNGIMRDSQNVNEFDKGVSAWRKSITGKDFQSSVLTPLRLSLRRPIQVKSVTNAAVKLYNPSAADCTK